MARLCAKRRFLVYWGACPPDQQDTQHANARVIELGPVAKFVEPLEISNRSHVKKFANDSD